jgi:3-phenylpropionate/trans-cinnamate dioxygenase ferredoxin reductase component
MTWDSLSRIVVVGGGVAAQRCLWRLRDLGYDRGLTMVSEEGYLPYDRTQVSKELLRGGVAEGELALATEGEYAERGIELRLGSAAVALEPAARKIVLSDAGALDYDRLVIATGGRPRLPPRLREVGVHLLRSRSDAARLREELAWSASVAIVGGGFIGGEVATAARAAGLKVTLIEAAAWPLSAGFGDEVGKRIAALHRAAGVDLRCGVTARTVGRSGEQWRLQLSDGGRISADTVVVGVGMQPNTEWLHGSGVTVAEGVLTDENCRTKMPGILAAGDCARFSHRAYGRPVRIEHWQAAMRHGEIAAHNALGEDSAFAPVPFFWSDQHGVKHQSCGLPAGFDEVSVTELGSETAYIARYRQRGRLIAAFAAGSPVELARARKELFEARPVAAV